MSSMALSLCRKELQADGGGALGIGFLRSGGRGDQKEEEEEEGHGAQWSSRRWRKVQFPPQEPRVSPVSRSEAEEVGGGAEEEGDRR